MRDAKENREKKNGRAKILGVTCWISRQHFFSRGLFTALLDGPSERGAARILSKGTRCNIAQHCRQPGDAEILRAISRGRDWIILDNREKGNDC